MSVLDLDSGFFCRNTLKSRSKYAAMTLTKCHRLKGHVGKCDEFPFVDHLCEVAPRVAAKIIRDSIMTTGAAWKSEDAGPNRILRWVMLWSDEDLLKFGINMSKLKPQVVAKLREKAADYDSCIRVALGLAKLAYEMPDAPEAPEDIRAYLEPHFGRIRKNVTACSICLLPLSFRLFDCAKRGKAAIETCHHNPRLHSPENTGFAHRECNIAQGPKTREEFYNWIAGILARARPGHRPVTTPVPAS